MIVIRPLPSEYGTYKTVTARLSGKSHQTRLSCSLYWQINGAQQKAFLALSPPTKALDKAA